PEHSCRRPASGTLGLRHIALTNFLQSVGALALSSPIAPSICGSVGPTPCGAAGGAASAGGGAGAGLGVPATVIVPPAGPADGENVAGMLASTSFISGSGSSDEVMPERFVDRYRIVPSAENTNRPMSLILSMRQVWVFSWIVAIGAPLASRTVLVSRSHCA